MTVTSAIFHRLPPMASPLCMLAASATDLKISMAWSLAPRVVAGAAVASPRDVPVTLIRVARRGVGPRLVEHQAEDLRDVETGERALDGRLGRDAGPHDHQQPVDERRHYVQVG